MNKVLIQTLEAILNQNHSMPFTVDLIDSTDNGSFKQAEIQMAGEWVGDVDVEAVVRLRHLDMIKLLQAKAESFR